MTGILSLLLASGARLAAALLALLLGLLPRPEGGTLPQPSPAPIVRPGSAALALAWASVDAPSLISRAPPASGPAASSFSPPALAAPPDGVLLLLTTRGSLLAVLARGCASESFSRAGEPAAGNCGGRHAGANWYAYCGNDPVNRADPSGLDWQWVAGAWNYVQGTDPFVPYPLFTPDAKGDQLYNVTYVNAGTYRQIRDAYCQRGFEKDLSASAQDFITAPLRIVGAGAVPTYASQLGPFAPSPAFAGMSMGDIQRLGPISIAAGGLEQALSSPVAYAGAASAYASSLASLGGPEAVLDQMGEEEAAAIDYAQRMAANDRGNVMMFCIAVGCVEGLAAQIAVANSLRSMMAGAMAGRALGTGSAALRGLPMAARNLTRASGGMQPLFRFSGSNLSRAGSIFPGSAVRTTVDAGGVADDLMAQVRAADFSTPRDEAVFWCGYREGNQTTAVRWAETHNALTIEMTPGGRWLNNLNLYGPGSSVTTAEADAIWRAASLQFARSASGRISVFSRGTVVDLNKTFYGIELPILRQNPNVSPTITYRGY